MQRQTAADELPQLPLPSETASSTTPTATDGTNPPCELDMFLTHGVSHGLDMLCTAHAAPGDVVLMERPSYFLAAGIFQSHGLTLESLPMKRHDGSEEEQQQQCDDGDGDGALMVDVDALQRGLEDGSIGVPRIIYVIPTHQNPTGNTMPIADRWKLCRLARKFGFLVAADEVYHLLDWRDDKKQRPARFSVLDRILSIQQSGPSDPDDSGTTTSRKGLKGYSVSVSSFTKIFTPGVRCGWIEGPTEIIDSIVDLGYIKSQGGCTPFVGNILRTALEEGFQDEILNRLNGSYRDRCLALCGVLESEPGIRIRRRPEGGYFLWVDFLGLPETASVFAAYCFDRGLRFMPGTKCDSVVEGFEQSGQPKELCENSARLCFADMDEGNVVDGATLLVRLYREYVGKD